MVRMDKIVPEVGGRPKVRWRDRTRAKSTLVEEFEDGVEPWCTEKASRELLSYLAVESS